MRPATILVGPVADTGVGRNLLMEKEFPPDFTVRRVLPTRAGAAAIGRNRGNPSARVRIAEAEAGATPVDAAGGPRPLFGRIPRNQPAGHALYGQPAAHSPLPVLGRLSRA